jgi:hypothetical protein
MDYDLAPYGVSAYGFGGGGTLVNEDLAEAPTGSDAATTIQTLLGLLADDGTPSDAAAADIAPYLRETMSIAGSADVLARLQDALAEGIEVSEAVVIAMTAYATGTGVVSGSLASVHRFLGAIADALVVSGLAGTSLAARESVIEAATLETLLQAGWSVEAVATADFSDALLTELRIQVGLAEAAAAADSTTPFLRLSALIAEEADATDTPATQMTMQEALTDGARVYVTLRLGDTEYAGWVLNTGLRAVTEYRNFAFNSFAKWQGRYYGFREEGLYLLEGDDDAGEPIDAWVRTALETFGTNRWKRIPDLYLGLKADGSLLVKAVTRDDATGAITEDWYVCEPVDGAGSKPARVKLGRGLASAYMGFEIRNVDGADFALDEIALRPLILKKRI